MEMMHQPLIWLADNLRTSYGENGLLPLLTMAVRACRLMTVTVAGQPVRFGADDAPTLRWPAWFAPTGPDRQAEASALSTMRAAGHVSRETAVKTLSAMLDVEDVQAELALIAADEAAADARMSAQAAQVKASETDAP